MTGSLLFFYGLSRFYSHRLFTLRRDEIECDEVEFLDRRHWKESIRRYEGGACECCGGPMDRKESVVSGQ